MVSVVPGSETVVSVTGMVSVVPGSETVVSVPGLVSVVPGSETVVSVPGLVSVVPGSETVVSVPGLVSVVPGSETVVSVSGLVSVVSVVVSFFFGRTVTLPSTTDAFTSPPASLVAFASVILIGRTAPSAAPSVMPTLMSAIFVPGVGTTFLPSVLVHFSVLVVGSHVNSPFFA